MKIVGNNLCALFYGHMGDTPEFWEENEKGIRERAIIGITEILSRVTLWDEPSKDMKMHMKNFSLCVYYECNENDAEYERIINCDTTGLLKACRDIYNPVGNPERFDESMMFI